MHQMFEEFKAALKGEVFWQEPMKHHTTFRIGGPADIFILPKSIEDLELALGIIREKNRDLKDKIPYMVIGAGSNLLVSDKGIRGIVIKIGPGFDEVVVDLETKTLHAGAGATLTRISKKALEYSLTGLEFAEGIPGSVGGALVMNAGAYGGEISQVLKTVTVLNDLGELITYSNEDMHFRYRHSRFMEERLIAVKATFMLKEGCKTQIAQKMNELREQRRSKQPIEMPCAGSIFKRPPDHYVGPMVEQAGLKGYRIGGAEVSKKHAGFIINVGDATCKDVVNLINFVKKTIKEKYNVDLEPEVRVVGEE